MSSYELLSQADEGVEEKLYKRLAKRLLAEDSPVSHKSNASVKEIKDDPMDVEEAEGHDQDPQEQSAHSLKVRERWKEDALLDFAAFEANLVRVQFLLDSNERERLRYMREKTQITETAQAVKDGNLQLHEQLHEARKTMARRKTFDVMAASITLSRTLRSREEQNAQIANLRDEIDALERESRAYSETWNERREQFGKLVDEGTQLLRLIRDEKEEADRQDDIEVDTPDEGQVMEDKTETSTLARTSVDGQNHARMVDSPASQANGQSRPGAADGRLRRRRTRTPRWTNHR
ncbi:hypothetical protein MRB53_037039 [Persea americana]|nr:hypothetical protein MRB53_037039 [Persea americana]